MTVFSVTQRCNVVMDSYKIVSILQYSVAKRSSLEIVPCL